MEAIYNAWNFGQENPYRVLNSMINNYFLQAFHLQPAADYIDQSFSGDNAYYLKCYMRDLVLGTFVYWATAGIWSFFEFYVFRDRLFTKKDRPLPTTETLVDQMCLAQASLLVYAGLPVLSEFLIESRFTHAYFYISDVGGWGNYFLYLFIYLVIVEVGIYWMHRTLHTNKFLYKYVHGLHHKYNSPQTLSPWASIAFNPIDGILQASPYVVGLFIVPVHYLTHVLLLFFTGVWATNIHDSLWGDTEPIMGSKYHTLHHTKYIYNYGQFFIFCDYIFGTLKVPEKTKLD